MQHTLPHLTVIIGGAASGKSDYAENLIISDGRSKIYLATAQAHDTEMATKILKHQRGRGKGWNTIEAPLDLVKTLDDATASDVILLDCATLWLTNHILANLNVKTAQSELLRSLKSCAASVVVVTNEVGAGIVPDNVLSRQFRNFQGQLNRALANQADLVITVIAGLPLTLKGTPV